MGLYTVSNLLAALSSTASVPGLQDICARTRVGLSTSIASFQRQAGAEMSLALVDFPTAHPSPPGLKT